MTTFSYEGSGPPDSSDNSSVRVVKWSMHGKASGVLEPDCVVDAVVGEREGGRELVGVSGEIVAEEALALF